MQHLEDLHIKGCHHAVQGEVGALGDLIEQAEVCGENTSHAENEHHNDNGAQRGQGHIPGLLELGRAVQHRRLIKRLVHILKTCYKGQTTIL